MSLKSTDQLEQIFGQMGIVVNRETCLKLQSYLILLEKWNSRINLTASRNWRGIGPFLLEGVWASRFYPGEATAHLDIGSGGGFPALPIRILVPRIQLDMVESRAKRAFFLETAANMLGLVGTCVYHARLDELLSASDKVWDCCSWKGLKLTSGDLRELCKRSHAQTQFWMFHGRELAVEEPEIMERSFSLLRSERFPLRKDWTLSIYVPK
jgi:16S rRNA G527 N7-methylase RsmG